MQVYYYGIFAWLALMALMQNSPSVYTEEYIYLADEEPDWRVKKSFALLTFLPIMLLVAFGPERSDMYLYMLTFRALPDRAGSLLRAIVAAESPGFTAIGAAVKLLFGNSTVAYRIVLTLIYATCILPVIRKYSKHFVFTVYLFVACNFVSSYMMNGMRQFVAVCMIFAATPLLLERKYLHLVLVILIAATVHKTALIMLPIMFIVNGLAWNKWTLLFSAIVVLATAVWARNLDSFEVLVDASGYSLDAAFEFGDDGVNPIRVLVHSVPMLMAFYFRKDMEAVYGQDRLMNICINMSVVTSGIFLVGMVTSGIMVGRLPAYTSLYNLILLPELIDCCFQEGNAKVISALAVLFYFLYFMVA